MKKESVIADCKSLFNNLTPLSFDCGKLCSRRCCGGDENTGMILFPGEEALLDPEITVKHGEKYDIAVCGGSCSRRKRPLSCMIYPFFPLAVTDETGKTSITVTADIRADCPITDGDIRVRKRFLRAVRRAGAFLLLNDETKKLLFEISDDIIQTQELYDRLK